MEFLKRTFTFILFVYLQETNTGVNHSTFKGQVRVENSNKFHIITLELCIIGVHVTYKQSLQGPEPWLH